MMKIISRKTTISTLIFVLIVGLSISIAGCAKPPIASFSVDKHVTDVGTPVQFLDKSTGGVTSWRWDFGDGNSSTEQNPSHVYAKEGDFPTTLTVSNEAGNSITRTNIGVLQAPVAGLTAKNVALIDESIQFTSTSSGDITSYSWDFGDGETSTVQNPSHSYNSRGNFTVSLKVSNQLSDDAKTMPITILQPVKADFSASTKTTQSGSTIQFVDKSSGDITSYSWDFGDGQTSSEQNPSHGYDIAGSYNVTLTVSNDFSSDTTVSEVQVLATNLSVNIIMCSSVTSDKNYVAKPGATYNDYQPIYVYLEVKGFQQYHTSSGFEFWVRLQSLKLFKPDGSLLLNLSNPLEKHATAIDAPLYVYFWYFLGHVSPTDQHGEYRLECNVLDKQSGNSKGAFTTFVVK